MTSDVSWVFCSSLVPTGAPSMSALRRRPERCAPRQVRQGARRRGVHGVGQGRRVGTGQRHDMGDHPLSKWELNEIGTSKSLGIGEMNDQLWFDSLMILGRSENNSQFGKDFLIKAMIPVRENSEVVIIYLERWGYLRENQWSITIDWWLKAIWQHNHSPLWSDFQMWRARQLSGLGCHPDPQRISWWQPSYSIRPLFSVSQDMVFVSTSFNDPLIDS